MINIEHLLHRWNTLCSFLMFYPQLGAVEIDIHLGKFFPYKRGWNVSISNSKKKYTYIDKEVGYTTDVKPSVPDNQIFEANEKVNFQSSSAEKILKITLNYFKTYIAQKGYENLSANDYALIEKIETDKSNIYNYATLSDQDVDKQIATLFSSLQEKLNQIANSEEKYFFGAIESANSLIESFIVRHITGQITFNVLVLFIISFCKIAVNACIGKTCEEHFIVSKLIQNEINYLQQKVYELLYEKRLEYSLNSFYEITSLAILYGRIATTLISYVLENFSKEFINKKWLVDKYRSIDEMIVHKGFPTFIYPAILVPYSTNSYKEALLLVKSKKIEIGYVYPQIEKYNILSENFAEVFDAIEKYSSDKPDFNLSASLTSTQNALIYPSLFMDISFFEFKK